MPYHHIPGYTGHLPQNRERFGVNYREASAATIANQRSKGVFNPVTPMEGSPNHFQGFDPDVDALGRKPAKYSEKFVSARQLSESEGTGQQTAHDTPHAQAPFGVYPTATATGQMDYQTTSSLVAPNNQPPPADSMASKIAHRRVARFNRNRNGGLYRPDPYDDTTIDDLAQEDPKLAVPQLRSEYRSGQGAGQ